MRFDTGSQEFRGVDGGCGVITNLANVSSAESPALTSHQGAGDLSAGKDG
jgi:hypothetical protein